MRGLPCCVHTVHFIIEFKSRPSSKLKSVHQLIENEISKTNTPTGAQITGVKEKVYLYVLQKFQFQARLPRRMCHFSFSIRLLDALRHDFIHDKV